MVVDKAEVEQVAVVDYTSDQYRDVVKSICQKTNRGDITEVQQRKLLLKLYKQRLPRYQQWGWDAVLWIEENVVISTVNPDDNMKITCFMGELPSGKHRSTGKTWTDLWDHQKGIIAASLATNKFGELLYNLIVYCSPRGEGKSFMVALVAMYKFFVFPEQAILMVANSKEQVGHVHAKEIKKAIALSPVLLAIIGGDRNLIDRAFEIKDKRGRASSYIRPASSQTGLFSGISGFLISEYFKAKNTSFFEDAYSSTRAVVNPIGLIDSTVAPKGHHLEALYRDSISDDPKNKKLFFHYESNPKAKIEGFRNPLTTAESLDSYRAEMAITAGLFEMYFDNTWEVASKGLLERGDILATNYFGIDGDIISSHKRVVEAVTQIEANIAKDDILRQRDVPVDRPQEYQNKEIYDSLIHVDSKVKMMNYSLNETGVRASDLVKLGEMFDTEWVIGLGIDCAYGLSTTSGANTVMTCIAKGAIGSKSNPVKFMQDIGEGKTHAPDYIYILLDYIIPTPPDLPVQQEIISKWSDEYDGLETACSDIYNVDHLHAWLKQNDIVGKPEAINFTYAKQTAVFKLIFEAIKNGKLKCPTVPYISKHGDMPDGLTEEMAFFTHTFVGNKAVFGSSEKTKKTGVQDDGFEALAMGIYGMRHLGVMDMRPVTSQAFFGSYTDPNGKVTHGDSYTPPNEQY